MPRARRVASLPLRRRTPRPPKERPLDFAAVSWPAGQPIYRGHGVGRSGNVFNPGYGKPTRFAFFEDSTNPARGKVGVLYGGASSRVAISEYLFHDLPHRMGAILPFSELNGKVSSRLIPASDLRLARLHDSGLRVLGIRNDQLIDTPASQYSRTVLWAQALHESDETLQGLQWMSRQYNSERAIVLFADRVDPGELIVDPAWSELPYDSGSGLDEVIQAAWEAGILIIPPPP